MVEIERKFLVKSEIQILLKQLVPFAIRQGYIHDEDGKTVRVRTKGEKAFLTIKGSSQGISRKEFEYQIPFEDGIHLLEHFCTSTLSKDRYEIKTGNHTWEIDVFHGVLDGLIVAEIELGTEDEAFEIPTWIDREVSDDVRYYNSNLIRMKRLEF